MPVTKTAVLTLGHSPDPDDAFMWWPLFDLDGKGPRIETGGLRFEPVAQDIETLNERAEQGDLDITAISCAQYPRVKDRYVITACGSSMGDGYGPKLVARKPMAPEDLTGDDVVIAIPGTRTSAFTAARLRLGTAFKSEVVPFDAIIEAVSDGRFDAGIVIHEGQLTFEDAGLHLVEDLGAWWTRDRGAPLPLGLNVVSRDVDERIGGGTLEALGRLLRDSVEYALAHRDESLAYALRFARGMGEEVADRFVELYVNRLTLDFGETGQRAINTFLGAAHDAGLLPDPGAIRFIGSR